MIHTAHLYSCRRLDFVDLSTMPIKKRSIGPALEYGHPQLYNISPPARMLQDVTVRFM